MIIQVPVGDTWSDIVKTDTDEVFIMILNTVIKKGRYPGLRQFSYILFFWVLLLFFCVQLPTTSDV